MMLLLRIWIAAKWKCNNHQRNNHDSRNVIEPIWPACVGWQSCHPCRRLPARFLFWWLCWHHHWLTWCCSSTTVVTSHLTRSSSSPIPRHTWPIGPPGPANPWTRMASWFTVLNYNCVVLCVIFFADYWPSAPLALCDYVLFSSFSTHSSL